MQNNTTEIIMSLGLVFTLLVITTAVAVNLRDIVRYFQMRLERRNRLDIIETKINADEVAA